MRCATTSEKICWYWKSKLSVWQVFNVVRADEYCGEAAVAGVYCSQSCMPHSFSCSHGL